MRSNLVVASTSLKTAVDSLCPIEAGIVTPVPNITVASTGTNPDGWRRWWATEAERIGTNWRSLISLHFDICTRLQAVSSSWSRP